jgi:hypothetical protein
MNYLAILVAGIAATILGAIWYAPGLFGNTWMQGVGKTKEQVEADFSPMKIVGAFVGYLVAAYGIARILAITGAGSLRYGLFVGLLAAVCFAVATNGVNELMESRPSKVFLVNSLYTIVAFLIMGAIIGLWR